MNTNILKFSIENRILISNQEINFLKKKNLNLLYK